MPGTLADWTALASLVLSLGTMAGLIYQLYQSRVALQTQSLMRLEERFYSPEMIALRSEAAKKLLAKSVDNYELEDILDFFHDIVTLIRSGALDSRLAYEFYKYWIARYWLTGKDHVLALRATDDPHTYAKLEALAGQIIAQNPDVDYSAQAMKLFLTREARLPAPELAALLATASVAPARPAA